MRVAYGLLGVAFVVLLGAAFLLSEKKSGEDVSPQAPIPTQDTFMLTLSSPAFNENELIPPRFTCDGENMNPELRISGAPEGTASFVLIMDDPDIPESVKENMGIDVFNHWILFNMSPLTTVLDEGTQPKEAGKGFNSNGKPTYAAPCPPDREHRYFFMLYALSSVLDLRGDATRAEIEKAMQGKVLETATLMARYARVK